MNPNSQTVVVPLELLEEAHSWLDENAPADLYNMLADFAKAQPAGPNSVVATGALTDEEIERLTKLPHGPIEVFDSQDAKDAARYRWLRANFGHHEELAVARYVDIPAGIKRYLDISLDEAVDAGMAK